ncbi:MAG: hypothetical protein R2780_09720 [Crocinitomicaceae bacterium]
MLKLIKRINFLIIVLSSHLATGQSIKEVVLDLPADFLMDFGLPELSREQKDSLFKGETLSFGVAGNISIQDHDTINEMIGISFSENFDEAGYLLLINYQKQKKEHLIFVLQKGDHCCDWTEKLSGATFKKDSWTKKDSSNYFPEINWLSFYESVPLDPSYNFLNQPPPFVMHPKDGGFEVELAFDLIAMGFDNGEAFLLKEGILPRKLFLMWDVKKCRYELYYYENSN